MIVYVVYIKTDSNENRIAAFETHKAAKKALKVYQTYMIGYLFIKKENW